MISILMKYSTKGENSKRISLRELINNLLQFILLKTIMRIKKYFKFIVYMKIHTYLVMKCIKYANGNSLVG
jgi:hypothetical protein